MHHISCVVIVFSAVLVSTGLAAGPRVENVKPGLGQRGTTFDVRIEGTGFSDGVSLLWYHEGLTVTKLRVESETVLLATIQAATGCALGSHAFRVRSNLGLSDLRVMRVMPLPLVNEVEPNNTLSDAQFIAPGSTAVGVLPGEDVDLFKITMKKGQRLSAEVEGVRLAATLSDMKLLVRGPDGEPIATADDTPLGKQDPYLTLIAPADGDYAVQLESSATDSGDNTRYALHLGHFPRPDYVYPPGGRSGEVVTVQVRGDPTTQWTQSVTFQEAGTHDFYPEQEGLAVPSPIPFRVSPFENLLEQEPNNQPADIRTATHTLPAAFNGVISEPGDRDLFRFRAESGTIIEFAVFAAQLGSEADTVIRVLSADGTVLTSADDGVGFDSRLVWPCPSTGDYFLQVVEKRRAGAERFVYRVEVKPVDPALVAFLPRRDRRSQAGQSVSVPQGNRVLGFVAVRRQRWAGDAEINFPQLLPGMAAAHGRISDDEFLMPVVFEAAKDAPLGADLVPVLARSYSQSPTVVGEFEQTVDLVAASADRLYQGVTVNRLAMAVVEPAPFRINFAIPPTALPRDGSLELIVEVERNEGFGDEIDVTIPFLPSWVDGPEKITIPADQSRGRFPLRAHPQVATCQWPTVAEGKAKPAPSPMAAADSVAAVTGQGRPLRGRNRRSPAGGHEVASQLLSLEIAESPLMGEIGPLIATPGKTLQVTIPLRKSGIVPTAMTATLLGLPSRVESKPLQVLENDEQLVFTVQLAEDAPLGVFSTLVCELSGEWDGHVVTYRIGRGGSLKIVRPGELIVDETGRPLSPLEILRKQPVGAGEADKETRSR